MCTEYLGNYTAHNRLTYKGQDIAVERAAEPYQILWENLHLSACSVRAKCLLPWIWVAMTSAASIGSIYGLSTSNVNEGNTHK